MTDQPHPLKIIYLTAGAAGMYCGSCMHDNTLVRSWLDLGCDVQLYPLYTPIRTDEPAAARREVYLGGINVYLQQHFSLFRYLPRWLDRWLDTAWLLRWVASRGMETRAEELGALAVSMLAGEDGNQRKEIDRLVDALASAERPDVVILTNLLVAGCAPAIRRRLGVPVLATLQGDDIFLESLPEPFRSAALQNLQKNSQKVDGFLLHSRYYADFMQQYLGLPPDKMRVVPLGIDLRDFTVAAVRSGVPRPFTIGYLARLAPEKGLHLLVDAFIHVHQKLGVHDAHLRVAGWLGEAQRSYAAAQFARLEQAGLSDHFQYVGEVDRAGKVAFLQEIDILSVPTTYREPKGLYVLEALAAGVPVVQPDHGAFPELLASTAGGVLVPPENAAALAAAWQALRNDPTRRRALGDAGRLAVQERHSAAHMAKSTLATIRSYLADLPGAMEEPLATS